MEVFIREPGVIPLKGFIIFKLIYNWSTAVDQLYIQLTTTAHDNNLA